MQVLVCFLSGLRAEAIEDRPIAVAGGRVERYSHHIAIHRLVIVQPRERQLPALLNHLPVFRLVGHGTDQGGAQQPAVIILPGLAAPA